jgi:hypothetical protein
MRRQVSEALADRKRDYIKLENGVRAICEYRGWEHFTDRRGKPLTSYRAFCLEQPPVGLGMRPEQIDLIIAEGKKTAQEHGENPKVLLDGPGPATKEEKEAICANSTNTRGHGSTNAEYLTARIARDHPDVLERMRAGEFPSVRQAAIAAGIVKVPSDYEKCSRLFDKLTPQEQEQFLAEKQARPGDAAAGQSAAAG